MEETEIQKSSNEDHPYRIKVQKNELKKYGIPGKKGDPHMYILHADKATKRIIAPYVNIIRRGKRAALAEKDKHMEFFLETKPSILKRNLNEFLDDSVDLPSVLHESIGAVKNITKSRGARLYLVNNALNEIYICPKNQPNPEHRITWKMEEGTNVASYVAVKKEYVMIEDILTDPRFPDGIPYAEPTVKSVLCVPIVTPTNEVLAVIEMYRDLLQPPYEKSELKITVVVAGWIGTSISQNRERMVVQRQQKLNECLMDLIRCYFAGNISLSKMFNEIAHFAKQVIDAERTTVYILTGTDMTADIYDEAVEGQCTLKRQVKAHFNKEKSVASTVAKTGQIVNVQNVFKDFRARKNADPKSGFIERSVLAVPIMGVDSVLGVVEAVNKIGDVCFSKTDEEVFGTFTPFCSLAVYFSNVIDAKQKAEITSQICLDILKRHIYPCPHDTQFYSEHLEFDEPLSNLNDFRWAIGPDRYHQMPQMLHYMITKTADLEHVDVDNLMRFILAVRLFYRDNPYHNYCHAFMVTQCMYNILKRNVDRFTTLERNGLIVAALCHDVDHGGVTNSFLHLSEDPIALLHQDSPWENHHYEIAMVLLGQIPIYKYDSEDYKDVCRIIKDNILATDLTVHFRVRAKIAPIILDEHFDFENPVQRQMLISIAMTTCDLAGSCKPFPMAKKLTDALYTEFYRQGDIEREMGYTPLSTMDREKQNNLPEDQMEFLTVLVIPACNLLRKCFPNTSDLYDEACNLREAWLEILKVQNKRCWNAEEALPDAQPAPAETRKQNGEADAR